MQPIFNYLRVIYDVIYFLNTRNIKNIEKIEFMSIDDEKIFLANTSVYIYIFYIKDTLYKNILVSEATQSDQIAFSVAISNGTAVLRPVERWARSSQPHSTSITSDLCAVPRNPVNVTFPSYSNGEPLPLNRKHVIHKSFHYNIQSSRFK